MDKYGEKTLVQCKFHGDENQSVSRREKQKTIGRTNTIFIINAILVPAT